MRKAMWLIMFFVVCGIIRAEEWYRPVYGSYTNTSFSWTNVINDPAILRNLILSTTSASNQTFTVDLVGSSATRTNRIIASTQLGAGSNSLPTNLYLPMEAGDVLTFNATIVETNKTLANRFILYFQKNK